MARIEPAPPRPLWRRLVYAAARRRIGRLPAPVPAMAHHPTLLLGWVGMSEAVERSHNVDERLKNLAILKAAALVGCEWCLDYGSEASREAGVSDEQLRELPRFRESGAFSELERLVLEYAEAMTATPTTVSDELVEALRAHFDSKQIVELTLAIAMENLWGRVNWAFGIGSQGFSRSGACAIPEQPARQSA